MTVQRMPGSSSEFGFTLIELTIAILILSLIAVISFNGISSMITVREQLTVQTRKWYDVSLFFTRLENDLSQFRERKVRNRSGEYMSAFIGKTIYNHSEPAEDGELIFTRGGIPDQIGFAADLKRVGYRFNRDKKQVELLLWPTLDLDTETYPAVEVILDGVRDLRFRYWSNRKIWVENWPDNQDRSPIPRGVEVILQLETGETIRRVFSLWQGAYY